MLNDPLLIVLGAAFLTAAVVAYNWSFTYRVGRFAQRRNIQLLLIALLTLTGVLVLLYGFGVL